MLFLNHSQLKSNFYIIYKYCLSYYLVDLIMTLYSSFFSLNGIFLYLSRLIISRHESSAESLTRYYGHPLRNTSICNPKELPYVHQPVVHLRDLVKVLEKAASSDDPFSFSADKSLSCRDYSALLVGNPFRASPRTAIRRSFVYVVNTACFTSISEVTLNRKRVRNRKRWIEKSFSRNPSEG